MKLHLSYFAEKTTVTVKNELVQVKAFQIIVWVSISIEKSEKWDPRIPRIPAILDIGNTHNFALPQDHLVRWAGIHAEALPPLKSVRESGKIGRLHRAGLWLHSDGDPFRVNVEEGIAILDGDWPRLPILGLRALTNSNLQTFIYGDTRQVLIRTPPPWYWPF